MNLPSASVSGGHGDLNAVTTFNINNQDDFGNFAKDMLAVERYFKVEEQSPIYQLR